MSQRREASLSYSSNNFSNLDDPDLMMKSAAAYIERGWPVFPLYSISSPGQCACSSPDCQQKGKHPLRRTGIQSATTHLRDVLNWWEDNPDANIGIATGCGLLVIAVDPARDGSLEVLPINPIPQTGLVKTGNEGWHLYFTYKKNLVLNSQQDAFGPGIDLVAEGGYVVAPPSLHPSGQRYAWTSHIAPRVLPPKVLAQLEPEHGWLRSDYHAVLVLMQQRGYALTPIEIARGLQKDYSTIQKLLRRMLIDRQIYLVRRGFYAPSSMHSAPPGSLPANDSRTNTP